MGQFSRLHAFVCVQLEKRINRHELDTRAPVEYVARNAHKDLLHHAVGAVVAILERLAEQETIGIYQAVIDSPRVDANTVKRSRRLSRFAQPGEYLVPQAQHIPEAMSMQRHRAVRKTMHLFQAETAPVEARQDDAPALGAQIDRSHIARRHTTLPLSSI